MSSEQAAIRVLHVDDEPDIADMAAEFLERADEGLTVETALSAEDGLDRIEAADFDCIVSDYDMPGMNGIEFLEAIRSEHPELPFILFTGKGSEEVASDAISAGVTDYLQKERGVEQYTILANRIRNAVSGYRAQRAIEESERQLRRVYERITDGFFAVNDDWEYVYVNEEGAKLTDRSVEELVGTVVWEAFPELVDSPFEDALRAAMETGETTNVEAYYPPHDSWYDVRVYGATEGISIYFQDVTERRERTETLRLMDEIVQEMHDGAVIAQDGVIRYTNPRVRELLGLPEEALVGEPIFEIVAAEDRDLVRERHEARTSDMAGEPPDRYEIALVASDGSEIPVEITVSLIEYQDRPATVAIIRDI